LRDGRHHVDLAFLHEHHYCDRRNWPRHRKDAEDGVGLHRNLLLPVLIADRLAVDDLAVARDHEHCPGDRALIDLQLEKLRNARQSLGRESRGPAATST
jgi:hypothetical protein